MALSKSFLVKGALFALISGGIVSCADTDDRPVAVAGHSYVVCNAYDVCWRVRDRYTTYPSDQAIVYHDDAWWAAHEHDTGWRFETAPSDDRGYYDRDGNWHPFEPS